MTTIGIAVCGHKKRKRRANALGRRFSAPVAMDEGDRGSLANHDAAWRLAAEQGCEWSLVLEDDTVPVDGFEEHAIDAIRHLPTQNAAISFYTGTLMPFRVTVANAVTRAQEQGAAWLEKNATLWGPAIALPTRYVEPMLAFVEPIEKPYDTRLSDYVRNAWLTCFYTQPSLVDHADERSLISSAELGPRVAHRVGVPEWNRVSIAF